MTTNTIIGSQNGTMQRKTPLFNSLANYSCPVCGCYGKYVVEDDSARCKECGTYLMTVDDEEWRGEL